MKDRDFVLKLVKCLSDDEKEKVKILASRCIKMPGVNMKKMAQKPFEYIIGSMRSIKDGEENTMYILHALSKLDDDEIKPLDRMEVLDINMLLQKTRTMTWEELRKYLNEDGSLGDDEFEKMPKENGVVLTPGLFAKVWLWARMDERENIEKELEDFINEKLANNTENGIVETVQVEEKNEQVNKTAEKKVDEEQKKIKIKKLQKENQELKIKYDNLKKENDTYKRDNKRYREDLYTVQNEIDKLKKQIETEKKATIKLNAKATNKDAEIAELKAQVSQLQSDLNNMPRVVLFCRSDEKYIKSLQYRVDTIHTPVALEKDHLDRCVAIWIVTSDYTYAELLTIRNALMIKPREFYSLDQLIEEMEGVEQ